MLNNNKINRFLLSLFLIVYSQILFSQCINLVPNSDFESDTACTPTSGTQLTIDWVRPTKGSSDYFNSCFQNNLGVPDNVLGSQVPRSGNAYAGFYVFVNINNPPNGREYIQAQLLSPLTKNKTYDVEIFVSLSDRSKFATDEVDVLFTVNPISRPTFLENIVANPQINSPAGVFITNTTGWTKISGSFVADSAYAYIVIGNFHDNASTNTMVVNSASSSINASYYYIEDISVIESNSVTSESSISICAGESTTISVIPTTGSEYLWNTNENTPSIIVSPLVDSIYVLQTTNGECIFIDSFAVDVSPFPTVYASASDGQVCKNDAVILSAIGANTYRWYNSIDSAIISVQNSFSTFADNDYYFVIGSINGCESSDTVFMDIVDCSPTLYYPNSFTPDGDGLNDVFSIQSSLIQSIHVKIHNRWGNEIYSWNTIEGSWDGTLNGELLNEDIYVLCIDYLTKFNTSYTIIDKIILIR